MSHPNNQSSQSKSARGRFAARESNLCQYPFADGRRCRMLRHPAHPTMCPFHARAELQLAESGRLGTELSRTLTGDFMTATDINHVLGRLFTAVAQDRVPHRNAVVLTDIARLLLRSAADLKAEYKFTYPFDDWGKMLERAPRLSPPPSFSAPAAPLALTPQSLASDKPTAQAATTAATTPPEEEPKK